MFASNTIGSVINVALGSATSIPLPNNQNLDGFTVNGTNTTFTVPQSGDIILLIKLILQLQ